MIFYHGTLALFKKDVDSGRIADKIEESFLSHGFHHNNPKEHAAYVNSLRVRRDVLCDKDAKMNQNLKIAIEFKVPNTSKRVDFLITGYDELGEENAVIIELKQWTECEKTDLENLVYAYVAGRKRNLSHPSYQAYSYAQRIKNFNQTVQEKPVNLYPCAYCHNYEERWKEEIEDPRYDEVRKDAPLFLSRDRLKLRRFIKKYIKNPDKGEILYQIDNGKIRPSVELQDAISKLLHGNKEFNRIDEQQVAFSVIQDLILKSYGKKTKHTIIVKGGPGTGKTVIARNLLSDLICDKKKEGLNVCYVSKNAAPRNVYAKRLIQDNFRMSYISNLFKGSGSFVDAKENEFDCILADEAHRLNARSGLYGNQGENQIKEIIHASKVSVFFIDEDQIVTAKDIGSVDEIRKWAKEEGSIVHEGEDLELVSQFRCNGSDGYLCFLDNLLQIRETANVDREDRDYDVKVYDDPVLLREDLRKKNERNNKSRRVAGYCYPWVSKRDPSLYDIVLENGFRAQWNFNDTKTWAIDKDSFDQVGCIHTCQGLEFDYVGVIIGKDLIYRKGEVLTVPSERAKTDISLKGCHDRKKADKIIRDTYKTLLTRGQKGCYIYCEDKRLSSYIKKCLKQS